MSCGVSHNGIRISFVFLSIALLGAGSAMSQGFVRQQKPHPVGLKVSEERADSFVGPLAPTEPSSPVFAPVASNVKMVYSGSTFATCPSLAVGTKSAPGHTVLFTETLPTTSAASTYVDVTFTTNLNFYPGTVGMGTAVDCQVQQDLDSDGTYETTFYCSGVSADIKPWLAFDPSTDPLGSAFQTTFRGYALVTALNTAGNPVPTRVVIELLTTEWSDTSAGGKAYACNNNLRIAY